HEELGRLHPERLGSQEVPELVQHDRDQDDHDEAEHAKDHLLISLSLLPESSRARVLAQRSASYTSSTRRTTPGSCSARTSSTVSTIARNGSLAAPEAATAAPARAQINARPAAS